MGCGVSHGSVAQGINRIAHRGILRCTYSFVSNACLDGIAVRKG